MSVLPVFPCSSRLTSTSIPTACRSYKQKFLGLGFAANLFLAWIRPGLAGIFQPRGRYQDTRVMELQGSRERYRNIRQSIFLPAYFAISLDG